MKKKLKKFLNHSPYSLYERYRDQKNEFKRDFEQRKIIDGYLKNNEIKKLQIGCGSNFLEGWLNTDLNFNEHVAFLDAGKIFPLESNSFNFVYSEHLFEHLTLESQLNLLTEGLRILKKGGVMRIATPSLAFLFNLYNYPEDLQNKIYVDWAVKNIPNLKMVNSVVNKEDYPNYVINNFFKDWGHQMIHNFESLKKLALQCGFAKVRECEVGKSDYPDLIKIEKHGTIIPPQINLMETMVLEIIK